MGYLVQASVPHLKMLETGEQSVQLRCAQSDTERSSRRVSGTHSGEAVHEPKASDFATREETTWCKCQQHWLVCALVFITGVWLAAAIVYGFAAATTGGLSRLLMPTTTANAVLTLRVLSEGVNVSLAALIGSTLTLIMWTTVSSAKGASLSTVLALSPTTGVPGLLQLLTWNPARSNASEFQTRLLSFIVIVLRFMADYGSN